MNERKIRNILRIVLVAVLVIVSLAVYVITIIVLPVGLKNGLCHIRDTTFSSTLCSGFLSEASHEGWASFFGSYLGGVFGGVATLIALILTILYNMHEIKRKSTEEKEERIKKSALIIYFDFKFILENIYTFLDELRDKRDTDGLDPCDN